MIPTAPYLLPYHSCTVGSLETVLDEALTTVVGRLDFENDDDMGAIEEVDGDDEDYRLGMVTTTTTRLTKQITNTIRLTAD